MQGLVIVTGGSRGSDAAICRRLAKDGHVVAVTYFISAAQPKRFADIERRVRQGRLNPAATSRSTPTGTHCPPLGFEDGREPCALGDNPHSGQVVCLN